MAGFSRRRLRTEGTLAVLGAALTLLAFVLVTLAKRQPLPPDAVDVNRATAEQLALTLGIDVDLAGRLCAYRSRRGDFPSVDALLTVPVLTRDEAAAAEQKAAAAHLHLASADAAQLAGLLGVSAPASGRIVQWRTAAAAGAPLRPHWLARVPAIDPAAVRGLLQRLVVRTPAAAALRFWPLALAWILAALFLPAFLRRFVDGDPFLLPVATTLTGLGAAMLYSQKDPIRDTPVAAHHLAGALIGLVAFGVAAATAPAVRRRLRFYSYLWIVAAGLLTLLLALFGTGPGSVRQSLAGIQPVEVIKLLIVLFAACYLADRSELLAEPGQARAGSKGAARLIRLPRRADAGPIAVMVLLSVALFALVGDFGPCALVLGAVAVTMTLATGRSVFAAAGFGAIALVALAAAGLSSPSIASGSGPVAHVLQHLTMFRTRVDMWLSPFDNVHRNGMQLAQGYWGMASGGLEGSGLGLGLPGIIPRGGSDFAFASWAEEAGFIGAWFALILLGALITRMCRAAVHASHDFDRSLGFALATLFTLQVAFIVCGVTGVVPLSGIALPFMSYGNTALVASFLALGAVRGISASREPLPVRPSVERCTRGFVLASLAVLAVPVGIARLLRVQIAQADVTAARAIWTPDADGVRRPHINPRLLAIARGIDRGTIYDRNRRILATSRADQVVRAVPDVAEARRIVLSGRRWYPFGAATANLVGYADPVVGGPTGSERAFDDQLRGFHSYADLVPDYRNANLPFHGLRHGADVTLTIDAVLQQAVAREFAAHTAKPGAYVLLNAVTGDVVAEVSQPSFDPNHLDPAALAALQSPAAAGRDHPMVNRAADGLYPPGSTLKIATAAAALDLVPSVETYSVRCDKVSEPIRWTSGRAVFVRAGIRDDPGDPNFGELRLPEAFRVSSNIYFAHLAVRVGATALHDELANRLRLRHTPPVQLVTADLPDIGYGQGRMLVTPMEMARLAGAVANDGLMMRSHLVAAQPPAASGADVIGRAMSERTAHALQGMMRSVVLSGTAAGVFTGEPSEYPAVAGKTGTAQTGHGRPPHAWFVGYAPFVADTGTGQPYAFACIVEHGGYGRGAAASICRDALRSLFHP